MSTAHSKSPPFPPSLFSRTSPARRRRRQRIRPELFPARVPPVGELEAHAGRNARRPDEGPAAHPERPGQLYPTGTATGQYSYLLSEITLSARPLIAAYKLGAQDLRTMVAPPPPRNWAEKPRQVSSIRLSSSLGNNKRNFPLLKAISSRCFVCFRLRFGSRKM